MSSSEPTSSELPPSVQPLCGRALTELSACELTLGGQVLSELPTSELAPRIRNEVTGPERVQRVTRPAVSLGGN